MSSDAYAVAMKDAGITVPVARTVKGPIWATYLNEDIAGDVWCYECGSMLYLRTAHTRSRNGITFHVMSHFCHYPSSCCSGESYLHAAAKHAIVEHAAQLCFFHTCTKCKEKTSIHVHNETLTPEVEVAVDEYRVDVGFLSTSGDVRGVVEVLVTHEMGPVKRNRLSELGIAWCEVKADALLEAVRLRTYQVDVFTCALSIGLCQPCMMKAKEQARCRVLEEIDNARRAALAIEEEEIVIRSSQQRVEKDLLEARLTLTQRRAALEKARLELRALESARKEARVEEIDLDWEAKDKEGLLLFGKYKGHHIQTVWNTLKDKHYIVFLEGYSGRFDPDRTDRAERHELCHIIPKEIMVRAHKILVGKCRRCFVIVRADWQTWCTSCFRDLVS